MNSCIRSSWFWVDHIFFCVHPFSHSQTAVVSDQDSETLNSIKHIFRIMLINISFLLYKYLCCFHKYFKSNQATDFCFKGHGILQVCKFYKPLWKYITRRLNVRYLEIWSPSFILVHMLITHIIGMSKSKQVLWKKHNPTKIHCG